MTDNITLPRSVVEQALTYLGDEAPLCSGCAYEWGAAIRVLRAALEQPQVEQEPVAWLWIIDGKRHSVSFGGPNSSTPKDWIVQPLYTHPQTKRQPLTDSVKDAFFEGFTSVETYNDTRLNSVEEAWAEYKAAHGIGGEK